MSWSSWGAGSPTSANWPVQRPVTGPAGKDWPSQKTAVPTGTPTAGSDFRDALRSHLRQPLRWSRHAEERLRSTGIQLGSEDMRLIQGAVDSLAQRGARDALVVYDQLALVISVSNRTVVTAATPERWQDGIFTQIDGAAIIRRHGKQGAGPQTGEAPGPWNDGSGPKTGRFEQS